MRLKVTLGLLLAALWAPAPAYAQYGLNRGDRFLDASSSVSFFTDRGPRLALLRNRRVFMLGLKDERVFSAGRHFAWSSTLEVPISLVLPQRGAPTAECWWRPVSRRRECYDVSHPDHPVGAVGFTPLGVTLYYGPERRVRLFGSLAVGLVVFDRNMPVVAASAVNFATEYRLGAEVAVSAHRSLAVAWKFQHWSNANLTRFNPGLDVNLVTLGLKRRR